MDFYRHQSTWKFLLIVTALVIVAASLWYANILARDIAKEEKKKVTLWANAYRNLNLADDNTDISFLFEVIKNNRSVPVILADTEDNILAWRNLDSVKAAQNSRYLKAELAKMKTGHEPIQIETTPGEFNYIYYENSFLLTQLRYFPYIMFGILGLLLLVAYIAFTTTKSAEQNQLWVGMAKETAHQLGTPISSLSAWMELLRSKTDLNEKDHAVFNDMDKDIDRLELVAERFSKIGSKPALELKPVKYYLEKSFDYVRKRSSEQVKLTLNADGDLNAMINPPLLEWVIENLLKNALDAISGKGSITIDAIEEDSKIIIDVQDSGKGIPKSSFKTVFRPGYSTKKRGWGLGLALSKRIIEKYHFGKIFVKESNVDSGTVFRIILPGSA